jgi:hypothetical protein
LAQRRRALQSFGFLTPWRRDKRKAAKFSSASAAPPHSFDASSEDFFTTDYTDATDMEYGKPVILVFHPCDRCNPW